MGRSLTLMAAIRTAVATDETGFYSIFNLPIGGYTLTVEKLGFRRYARAGLVLSTGGIHELKPRSRLARSLRR
jgi:hypothetical protein